MKKILLFISIAFLGITTSEAQIVLDDFNDGDVSDWDTTGLFGSYPSLGTGSGNKFEFSEQGGELKLIYRVNDATYFPHMSKLFASNIDMTNNQILKVRYKTSNLSSTVRLRVELGDQNVYVTNAFAPDVTPLIADGSYHDYYFNFYEGYSKWFCSYDPIAQLNVNPLIRVDSANILFMRVFVDYGQPFEAQPAGTDSIFIDEISMVSSMPDICANITDPNILENFETERHINYSTIQGYIVPMNNIDTSVANPSYGVGKLLKDGISFSNGYFTGDLCDSLVLTTNNQFKIDVYNTDAAPKTVLVDMQNFDGVSRRSVGNYQIATTTKVNQWEELTFDFKENTDSVSINTFIAILNPGGTVYDSLYIDNIRLNGFVAPIGIKENSGSISNLNIYPNPFSDKVNIEYTLKKRANVEINIIDILGRRIDTFINENQSAGKQTTKWIPEQTICEGIYYCVINIDGNKSETLKLIYTK